MKHKPFEKFLTEYLNDKAKAESQPEKQTMVNATTTTAAGNKKGKTQAHIKDAVKKAKKYLKEHPHTTQKDLAKIVGIAPMTLAKHMKSKRGVRGPYKQPTGVTKAGARNDLFLKYQNAQTAFEEARQALIEFIQKEGL